MEYIVWKQEEYGSLWGRWDCQDEDEVTSTVLELVKLPGEIEVSRPIPYKVRVSLIEEKKPTTKVEDYQSPESLKEMVKEAADAAKESGPEDDKSTRGKSHRSVR